jgi:uncharacterized protein YciI
MDVDSLLKGFPALTLPEMQVRWKDARHYTIVLLRRGPASREDKKRNEQLQLEHLQHLMKLQMAGKLVLNGPTLVEHEILGVSIYDAELEDARAMAEADPMVKTEYLIVEAIPWMDVPNTAGTASSDSGAPAAPSSGGKAGE